MTVRPSITGEQAGACVDRRGRQGRLIAVEGPGGVGASTVTALIAELLRAQGVPVLVAQKSADASLGALARQGAETIRPALDRGDVVLCDRYIVSSLVAQRMDGSEQEFVGGLQQRVVQPDLVIMITALPDVLAERATARGAHSSMECARFAEAGRFLRSQGVRVLDVDASHVDAAEVARTAAVAITRIAKGRR
ncbi:hypothetical protein [Streptomyces sp. NPDC007346]|uniref:hypothetical protein n=1 Tax=Streptomyces sp. NPDC007346 TaxID=3154682 RepID=UPI0034555AF2